MSSRFKEFGGPKIHTRTHTPMTTTMCRFALFFVAVVVVVVVVVLPAGGEGCAAAAAATIGTYSASSWSTMTTTRTKREQSRRKGTNDAFASNNVPLAFLPTLPTLRTSSSSSLSQFKSKSTLFSTPFDASLYFDLDDNPLSSSSSPSSLGQPPGTPILLGLNKYSHDASVCAASLLSGEVLYALSKERSTRRKHDGGNVASLVESCLDALGLDLDDVKVVVCNNHHHRLLGDGDDGVGGGRIWGTERDVSHMQWEEGLGINGGTESGYTDEENLLTGAERFELSHHLAHAYSAAAQCPFPSGLIVVMDGMGETYRAMKLSSSSRSSSFSSYASDLDFDDGTYQSIPSDIADRAARSVYDWREAESAYTFVKDSDRRTIAVRPVFKRYTEERSPPALYNHGFENMDSVGAIYSRSSSHIFGDWNACGKVMGLAPWMGHVWETDGGGGDGDAGGNGGGGGDAKKKKIEARPISQPIMWGHLYVDDAGAAEKEGGRKPFRTDVTTMKGLPHVARADPDLFDEGGNMKRRYDFDDCDGDTYSVAPPPQSSSPFSSSSEGEDSSDASLSTDKAEAAKGANKKNNCNNVDNIRLPSRVALDAIALSHRVQSDLEDVVLDLVRYLKDETGESNLCLVGGVALNSVLNGRIGRELGFDRVYIPPYPGDDGIAVGCCAYGLWGNAALDDKGPTRSGKGETSDDGAEGRPRRPPLWPRPLSPYLGPVPSDADIMSALEDAAPWLVVEHVPSESRRHDLIVQELNASGVVALYRGRSEAGPRALGHRSILADPRKKGLVRFINEKVKLRESFRPFAPSVLAEHAPDWFELGGMDSPYMSLTAQVKEDKMGRVPAVTHVDGSSRLQTVTEESEPSYHALIRAFYKLTGVPMVLNTSFNTLPGEPIVETPRDAIRSFLCSMGSIEMLFLGEYVVRRRDADVRSLLGMAKRDGTLATPPLRPVRAGPFEMMTETFVGDDGPDDVVTSTRVRMSARAMHDDRDGKGWFDLLDDLEVQVLAMCDGTNDVQDMLAEYIDDPEDGQDETETQDEKYQANVFSNIMRRLTRLFEYGFISW